MKKVGMVFLIFSITLNLTAQWRVNLDTLNFDQLNVYKHKAVRLRTTGLIMTATGVSLAVTGWMISSIWAGNYNQDWGEGYVKLVPMVFGMSVGIPAAIVGIPLYFLGDRRNTKAELALRRFDMKTDISTGFGLAVIIRF